MLGAAQLAAPDRTRRRIAGAVEALVRERYLEPDELVAGDEVRDAGNRVGTVDRGRALLQHLDAVECDRRKRVDVDETAAEQPRRQRRLTPAVEQHQCPRGPETPQIDVRHVLGHRMALVVVPTVRLADDAGRSGQVLEQIDHLQGPLFFLEFPVQHFDGVGKVDGRLLDRRAGHDHHVVGVEVEHALFVAMFLVFVVVVLRAFLPWGRIDKRNLGGSRRSIAERFFSIGRGCLSSNEKKRETS